MLLILLCFENMLKKTSFRLLSYKINLSKFEKKHLRFLYLHKILKTDENTCLLYSFGGHLSVAFRRESIFCEGRKISEHTHS